MTNSLLYLAAVLIGLIFGSFANVLILRDRDRKSIWTGRSRCPQCGHTLTWYELLPLASFVLQKGRCRSCEKKISWQYPVVESLTGALFAFAVWYGVGKHDSYLLAAGLAIAFFLFLVISVIDIRTQEVSVYDHVVLAALAGGVAAGVSGHLSWLDMGLGVVVGAGSIAVISGLWKLIFKEDGMGSGDIWIAGAVGAVAGYPLVIIALMAAVYSGAIVGIIFARKAKAGLKVAIPFGPFLFIGLLTALACGQAVLAWYIL